MKEQTNLSLDSIKQKMIRLRGMRVEGNKDTFTYKALCEEMTDSVARLDDEKLNEIVDFSLWLNSVSANVLFVWEEDL